MADVVVLIPRKLWVDLTEFGFGIREVPVLSGSSGDGQPAPNTVGSEEIKDGSIRVEDLDPNMFITVEEARNVVADAIERAEREHGEAQGDSSQDAGSDTAADDGSGDI